MSVDREYRIRISTVADVSGAHQAASAQEEVAAATRKSEKAAESATGEVLGLGKAHKELHKLMHLVTEESPLLGVALRGAFSPAGAALLGAILLFKQASHQIEELNKQFDEMEESARKPIGDMKAAMREANEEVSKGKRAFGDWLESLEKVGKQTGEQLDEDIEKLHGETEAVKELLKAQAELQKARIDEKVKTGEMPEAQGIIEKAEIDRRLAHGTAGTEREALQREFDLKAKALTDTSGTMMTIGSFLNDLEGKANDAGRATQIKRAQNRLKGLAEQAGGESDAEQAHALLDAQTRAQEARSLYDKRTIDPITGRRVGAGAYVDKLKAEAEMAESHAANMELGQKEMAKTRQHISDLQKEQEGWNTKLELAKKDFAGAAQAFDVLSKQVESARLKLQQFDQFRPGILTATDQASGAKAFSEVAGSDYGKMLYGPSGGAAKAAWELLHKGNGAVGAEEGGQLDALMKFLGANQQNGGKILTILAHAYESISGQQEAINMLEGKYKELASRSATVTSSRMHPGGG